MSGDVGPVVFDQLQTWWPIARGSGSDRFPACRTRFFDDFRLFEVGLVDSERFPPWRQWTGRGFSERSLMCQTTKTYWARLEQPGSFEK